MTCLQRVPSLVLPPSIQALREDPNLGLTSHLLPACPLQTLKTGWGWMQPEREERGLQTLGGPGFAPPSTDLRETNTPWGLLSSPSWPGGLLSPGRGAAVIPDPGLPQPGSSCLAVSLPPLVPASCRNLFKTLPQGNRTLSYFFFFCLMMVPSHLRRALGITASPGPLCLLLQPAPSSPRGV